MLALIFSAIPVILTAISSSGILPATITTLISNLLSPVQTLITNLKNGSSGTQDALAALAALSGVIAVLKAQPNLPQAVLAEIQNVDADVQKALAAYVQAEGGYNASLYAPIAPVA